MDKQSFHHRQREGGVVGEREDDHDDEDDDNEQDENVKDDMLHFRSKPLCVVENIVTTKTLMHCINYMKIRLSGTTNMVRSRSLFLN